MKVAIVAPSPVPYDSGGAEAVWSGLYQHLLNESPHDVELIKVPVRERNLPEVMAAYEAFAGLDLTHFDAVITGKYPAWMVRHPRHVVYMLHPLRGLYDSYGLFGRPRVETSTHPAVRQLIATVTGVGRTTLPDLFERWHSALDRLGPDHPVLTFPGPLARTLVRGMDTMALSADQVWRYGAISWTVAGREGYFPRGAEVRVVHPPSGLTGLTTRAGEYFFTASRHDAPKRLGLLIEGMRHYQGRRRLLIAGSGPQTDELRALARGDSRVEFVGRVTPTELVDHYSRAVGVPFIPFDEDLGLITYEAMASGKPVLTTRDSGGPMEFVQDGVTGVVVEPEPAAIGAGLAALEDLAEDVLVAERTRRAIRAQSWTRVARALLGQAGERPRPVPARRDRPRLVVTSTFPVWPPRSGGQARAFHLYGALAETFDIDLVCQAGSTVRPSHRVIRPGVTEHVVPRTREHEAAAGVVSAYAGIPVTDIVAARLSALSPAYAEALVELLVGSAGVVLADPFLYPVVEAVGRGIPVVYDAYNCEYILKSQMLPASAVAEDLLAEVREVEGAAARGSKLILTVSPEDRRALAEMYGVPDDRFVAAPNGTDLRTVRFTGAAARRWNRDRWLEHYVARGGAPTLTRLALFVGSWHEPNNVAARAIVQLAAGLPHVAFLLVGSHTGSLSDMRIPANVLTLGVVPDLVKATLLGVADVALAPLAAGSGTNLKVVEYLAAGIPVVSTSVGLRGQDLPEDAAVVAPVEGFAEAIRAVLAHPDPGGRADRVAEAVRSACDWRVIGRSVAPMIAEAIGARMR